MLYNIEGSHSLFGVSEYTVLPINRFVVFLFIVAFIDAL